MSMYFSKEHRDKQQRQDQSSRCRDFSGNGGVRSTMLRRDQDLKQQIRPLGMTSANGRVRARATSVERSPVTAFLREIGLPQYAELLRQSGFDDMETLLEIEDDHMKELGMPTGHMLKLKKRLREYEEQLPAASPPKSLVAAPVPRALPPGRGQLSPPSANQMTAVQMSWMQVKQIGTDVAGELYYKKFFAIEPEAKSLFPMSVRLRYRDWSADDEEDESDPYNSPALRKLWAKVVDAVGSAVAGMQDVNKLVPMLQQLGMRHVGYGLKPHYFQIAGKILVEILSDSLGDSFTKEVENAWVMVFSFMSATMLAGYHSMLAEIKAKEAQITSLSNAGSEVMTPTSATDSTGVADRLMLQEKDGGMRSRQTSAEAEEVSSGGMKNQDAVEASGQESASLPTLLDHLQQRLHGFGVDEKPAPWEQ